MKTIKYIKKCWRNYRRAKLERDLQRIDYRAKQLMWEEQVGMVTNPTMEFNEEIAILGERALNCERLLKRL